MFIKSFEKLAWVLELNKYSLNTTDRAVSQNRKQGTSK